MNFWQRAQNYPPPLCRLLARERYGRPLTTQEIARRSGLTAIAVAALSETPSWDGVALDQIRRFTQGCALDFCDATLMRRTDDYLRKRPTFHYLTSSPEWTCYYKPLITHWRQSYGATIDKNTWPPVRTLLERLTPLLSR